MIKIENLCVSYGEVKVFEDFNLGIEEGKVTCVLGESGSGKTTLLNAVAGLVGYGGSIDKIKSSYVFQQPRLIPNLTVLKNLTLIGADEQRAADMLERVGLTDKISSYPKSLSGGQAQRVSVLRAFLYPSDLILMDEPFSSLDLKLKLSVIELFNRIREEDGRTALFVTHDVDEALFVADRIIIMRDGKIKSDFENITKKPFGGNNPLREKIIEILTD